MEEDSYGRVVHPSKKGSVLKGVWASQVMFSYELSVHCGHRVSSESTLHFPSDLITKGSYYLPGKSKSSAEVGDWWNLGHTWAPCILSCQGASSKRGK